MAKIYRIRVGDEWMNEAYYDVDDAIEDASEIDEYTDQIIEIWEAEGVEDVPYDALEMNCPICLEWSIFEGT